MTESKAQTLLALELRSRGHEYIVPNVYLWSHKWESDLISITSSGYTIEFEIKRSEQDFVNDFSKFRHKRLREAYSSGRNSHLRTLRGNGPCRFIYVFTEEGIDRNIEIPEFAGKVEPVDGSLERGIRRTKLSTAPLLHKNEATEEVKEYLSRGLIYRYWNLKGDLTV